MPIRSLLSETSFNSEQTKIIAKAFDDAWYQVNGDDAADPAMASLLRTHSPNGSSRQPSVLI